MIVEKPEVLKQWMARTLEPMCDAEPTKLARYVLALVRKEISPEQLRISMLNNLDVFLHERAGQFAECLLAALETGSYTALEMRPDGRVVTLPAVAPARRHVILPQQDCSRTDRVAGWAAPAVGLSGPGPDSPARASPDRPSRSRSRSRSPCRRATSPVRPAAASEARAATDLRRRLGGAPGPPCHPHCDEPTELQQPEAPGLAASPARRPSLPSGADSGLGRPPPPLPSGAGGPGSAAAAGRSLLLRRVPAALNQMLPLSQHLAAFGRVLSIEVPFAGDPESALVTFSSQEEAEAALSSPEPVLGCARISVLRYPERPHQEEPPADRVAETITDPEAVPRQQRQAASKRGDADAIRRSQDLLAASLSLQAKQKEKRQEALRLAAELQRREAELLARQLGQQRTLLARLESPGLGPHERAELLSALRSLQTATLSTRAGLAAALQKTAPPARPAAADGAHTAERQLLDLELELYQRQQAGADTVQLQRRLAELRRTARIGAGRGRGRGATRSRGRQQCVRPRAQRPVTSVDRRPATLVVSDKGGLTKSAVLAHLQRSGEVASCREDVQTGCLLVTFGSRRQAEAALAAGAPSGGHGLRVGWPTRTQSPVATNGQRSSAAEPDGRQPVGDAGRQCEEADEALSGSLSDYEDEEEQGDERSWRR